MPMAAEAVYGDTGIAQDFIPSLPIRGTGTRPA